MSEGPGNWTARAAVTTGGRVVDVRADDDGTRTSGERITVALVSKAAEDLQRIQASTGFSKTDIVNRAISLYGFLQSQIDEGNDFIVRDSETGENQIVRFL